MDKDAQRCDDYYVESGNKEFRVITELKVQGILIQFLLVLFFNIFATVSIFVIAVSRGCVLQNGQCTIEPPIPLARRDEPLDRAGVVDLSARRQ